MWPLLCWGLGPGSEKKESFKSTRELDGDAVTNQRILHGPTAGAYFSSRSDGWVGRKRSVRAEDRRVGKDWGMWNVVHKSPLSWNWCVNQYRWVVTVFQCTVQRHGGYSTLWWPPPPISRVSSSSHSEFSMNLTTLGISRKWDLTVFVLLWLAYFIWHNVFKVYP